MTQGAKSRGRRPAGEAAQPVSLRVARHRARAAEAGLARVDLPLPADLVARLDAEAARRGLTRAECAAELLARALD